MKNSLTLSVLFLSLLSCVADNTNVPPLNPILSSSNNYIGARASGTNYDKVWFTELRKNRILEAPAWLGESAPPLSPRQAKAAARKYLEEQNVIPAAALNYDQLDVWLCSNITLRAWIWCDDR